MINKILANEAEKKWMEENRHKLPKKSECPFHGCWNNGKFNPALNFFCIGHSDD